MPSPPNITNIPPARVPFIDDRTGLMSREWYRFLLNLFTLTGGGSNSTSLQDVQLGPPGADEAALLAALQDAQLGPPGADEAALQAALRAYTDVTPPAAPATADALFDATAQLAPPAAPATADALFDAAAQLAPPAAQAAPVAFDTLDPPAFLDVPGRFLLPAGVTPGASPYTYQNTSGRPGDMIVSGGMVTDIAFSRDNATFYGVGAISGVFPLSAYDFLRVTYTVAPTMTFIPR